MSDLDPEEVDRIYAELMLQKKAQEELKEEENLTKEAIQEIIDKDVQEYSGNCKNIVKKLSELHTTNQELRSKNDEAENFAESEESLYEFIRTQVLPISADQPETVLNFIEADGLPLMLELMEHPNTDISINCAVQFLKELTDEDVKFSENVYEVLIKNEVLNFVQKVIQKGEEEQLILEFIENLIDIQPQVVADKIVHNDDFIEHFLQKIESTDNHDLLQSYTEVLSTILQSCNIDLKTKFIQNGGLLRFLGLLNTFRTEKLESQEQHEAMVSIFSSIQACNIAFENAQLLTSENVQGLQLLLSLFKKQKLFRRHIIKTLNSSLQNSESGCYQSPELLSSAKYFISDCGGLPHVFSYFMLQDKSSKGKILERLSPDDIMSDDEQICQLLLSLLINSQEGVTLDRILYKFIENKFEKLKRLVQMHHQYFQQIGGDTGFDLKKFNSVQDIEYLAQDYPQFNVLAIIDIILGWLWTSEYAKKLTQGADTWSFEEKIKAMFDNQCEATIGQSLKQVIRLQKMRCSHEEGVTMKFILDQIWDKAFN